MTTTIDYQQTTTPIYPSYVHKSKLKNREIAKGDIINVKIGSVNVNDRKITMNIV